MSRIAQRPLAVASNIISAKSEVTQTTVIPTAFTTLFQSRSFQTSALRSDIDQAAKYIGAGAATVGVAGSGMSIIYW